MTVQFNENLPGGKNQSDSTIQRIDRRTEDRRSKTGKSGRS